MKAILFLVLVALSGCCNCPQVNLKKTPGEPVEPMKVKPCECRDSGWPDSTFNCCNPDVDKY